MPNYTLVLTEEQAQRIKNLTSTFGGSVGGFAASFIADLSKLDAGTIQTVRQQLSDLARDAQSQQRGPKHSRSA